MTEYIQNFVRVNCWQGQQIIQNNENRERNGTRLKECEKHGHFTHLSVLFLSTELFALSFHNENFKTTKALFVKSKTGGNPSKMF